MSAEAADLGELHALKQAMALQVLLGLPPSDAIGAACSVLLHYSHEHPLMVRRVLHEPVIRDGFRGMSLLKTLTRT